MNDKLFDPVEFKVEIAELKSRPLVPLKVPDFPDYETFKPAIDKIQQEMIRVENGTSQLRKGAMMFPKGINPADSTLKLFEKDCSDVVIQRFLDVTQQDYGQRVNDYFIDCLREVHPKLYRRKSNE